MWRLLRSSHVAVMLTLVLQLMADRADLCEIIETQVCIIGGGSSGTYSAIQLQDKGHKITLIEKEGRLGGHANVYHVPGTNASFNYGVVEFENTTVVTDYFDHFGLPLVSAAFATGGVSEYADFATGDAASPAVLAAGNITAALLAYEQQLAKYPYLVNGFNLPSTVPSDLLLPWGDFVKKYDLGAMAYEIFLYGQGLANILALPTLYVMKSSDPVLINNLLTNGFLTTPNDNTQELYDRALVELGTNVLLSSNVTQVHRNEESVEVFVSTPHGDKLIKASKLIMAIEPKLHMLDFLDLGAHEWHVFGQFNNSYYWNAVINYEAIPDNVSVSNINPKAPYGIPALPGLYVIQATGFPGLHTAYYSSPHYLSDDAVKADITGTIAKLAKTFGWHATESEPEFVGFNCHCPFELQVSVDAIKNGFYRDLEGLQGQKSTFWTGAAWAAQDSRLIWEYTKDIILPRVIAAL